MSFIWNSNLTGCLVFVFVFLLYLASLQRSHFDSEEDWSSNVIDQNCDPCPCLYPPLARGVELPCMTWITVDNLSEPPEAQGHGYKVGLVSHRDGRWDLERQPAVSAPWPSSFHGSMAHTFFSSPSQAHRFLGFRLKHPQKDLDTWSEETSSLLYSLLIFGTSFSSHFLSLTSFKTMPQGSCCRKQAALPCWVMAPALHHVYLWARSLLFPGLRLLPCERGVSL